MCVIVFWCINVLFFYCDSECDIQRTLTQIYIHPLSLKHFPLLKHFFLPSIKGERES